MWSRSELARDFHALGIAVGDVDRFFARLVDGYLARTGNDGGGVGSARAYLLSAQGLYDFAAPVMQATASSLDL